MTNKKQKCIDELREKAEKDGFGLIVVQSKKDYLRVAKVKETQTFSLDSKGNWILKNTRQHG